MSFKIRVARPKAEEVLHHPLFWSSEKHLLFLQDASDRVELADRVGDSDLLKALENVASVALNGNWNEKLEARFIDNIGNYRRYKYNSVRDLLRLIRNKSSHYIDLPQEVQVSALLTYVSFIPTHFYEFVKFSTEECRSLRTYNLDIILKILLPVMTGMFKLLNRYSSGSVYVHASYFLHEWLHFSI